MRCRFIPLLVFLAGVAMASTAHAEAAFTVQRAELTDEKAVFATVDSPNVVAARTRIGGTVAQLSVHQGDAVTQGQVIAVVADEKLLLQIRSLDAQIAGLESQLAQAHTDLTRAETLFNQGVGPRTTLDQARTAVEVAASALRARTAERGVAQQNLDEGKVLAPVAGRVITVPLTEGTVVLNGDTIATVGQGPFILRLRVPERQAVSLKVNDRVRIDAGQLGATQSTSGVITLIYPQITDGRVVADAKVTELGDYFVGDRILVWISAGTREGYVVPESFLRSRFGLDYVLLRRPDGSVTETPVQRGEPRPTSALPDGIELLSGVQSSDVLVQP
jgi:RND family efflux transporter MFP subunit